MGYLPDESHKRLIAVLACQNVAGFEVRDVMDRVHQYACGSGHDQRWARAGGSGRLWRAFNSQVVLSPLENVKLDPSAANATWARVSRGQ
jgi:hypothetical protein